MSRCQITRDGVPCGAPSVGTATKRGVGTKLHTACVCERHASSYGAASGWSFVSHAAADELQWIPVLPDTGAPKYSRALDVVDAADAADRNFLLSVSV